MFTDISETIFNLNDTYIDSSNIHGNGLFAKTDIKAGVTLGYLDGQKVNWNLFRKYEMEVEWNALSKDVLLVRPFRTSYGFINHSRNPNIEVFYDPLRIVSKKNIKKDDELLLDYRKEPLPEEYIDSKGKFYL